ncbi:MAG: AraC family transcriptional regulator [Paenibacillus sp.]|nr:AraC family transcriptional regulator [Paenibacillus sp.]
MTMFPVNQRLSESPFHISDMFPFHINTPSIRSRYPAHRHDYLELSFVIEGYGYQLINGKKCPMMPGTCSFLLPFQVHELFAVSPVCTTACSLRNSCFRRGELGAACGICCLRRRNCRHTFRSKDRCGSSLAFWR